MNIYFRKGKSCLFSKLRKTNPIYLCIFCTSINYKKERYIFSKKYLVISKIITIFVLLT